MLYNPTYTMRKQHKSDVLDYVLSSVTRFYFEGIS